MQRLRSSLIHRESLKNRKKLQETYHSPQLKMQMTLQPNLYIIHQSKRRITMRPSRNKSFDSSLALTVSKRLSRLSESDVNNSRLCSQRVKSKKNQIAADPSVSLKFLVSRIEPKQTTNTVDNVYLYQTSERHANAGFPIRLYAKILARLLLGMKLFQIG